MVARARDCVGARFRVQGRDPVYGLDCVGVAAVAFGRDVAGDYALRGGDPVAIEARISSAGFSRVERSQPGDLLLIAFGQWQYHLAIRTDAGFIHAHAGLRRVVETPGDPENVRSIWREG